MSLVTDDVTDATVPPENVMCEDQPQEGHQNKRPRFSRDSNSAFGPIYIRGTDVWQSIYSIK
jgi:hypothetical protein